MTRLRFADEWACDILVVGGGTAGCLLASTVATARPDLRVQLLERGEETEADGIFDRYPVNVTRARWAALSRQDGPDERVPVPDTLGGSSLLHAGIALRGTGTDHAEWSAAAGRGWAPADITALFERLERQSDRPRVLEPDLIAELPAGYRAFHDYAARRFGTAEDLNQPDAYGLGRVPIARTDTRITSTLRSHLGPGRPPNLTVRTGLRAERLEGLPDSVRGVAARPSHGGETVAISAATIVLTAGAIGTAALLLRSGIGPSDILAAAGQPVWQDLPSVGATLRDHAVAWFTAKADSDQREPPWPWHVLLCRTRPDNPLLPDCSMELFADFRFGRRRRATGRYVVSLMRLREVTPGTVTLRPAPNGHAARASAARPADHATEMTYRQLASGLPGEPEFTAINLRFTRPAGYTATGGQLAAGMRSAYHFHGTCPMGPDPSRAVITPDLRLHHAGNVYIADASVLPTQFGANTHHVTRAIALRGAENLLADLQ